MKFNINENEPTSLLKDFAIFTEYLCSNEVRLTKGNKYINMGALFEINGLMLNPQQDVNNRSVQIAYPRLHLFYYLALQGKLFEMNELKGGNEYLKSTEILATFNNLTNVEKYITLLEILWVDCDFEKIRIQGDSRLEAYVVEDFIERVSKCKSDTEILLKGIFNCNTIILYLSYFGFWTAKEDEGLKTRLKIKRFYFVYSITISRLGIELAKVLNIKRNIRDWNLASRREEGEYKVKFDEEFYLPFKLLFNSGELEKHLPRETEKFAPGKYILKVCYDKNIWRVIEFSAHHTLLDVHNAIQKAFDFGNDHMYAFFMDGVKWSKYKFNSTIDEEGPYVDEAELGEISLHKKSKFLYLFDFGDEWTFNIEVIDIIEEIIGKVKINVLESKGISPDQYEDVEDDEEDDDAEYEDDDDEDDDEDDDDDDDEYE